MPEKVQLRNILQVGIILEEQGNAFYERLAGESKNEKLQVVYRKLAKDEIEHKELIEDILSRWLEIPLEKKICAELMLEAGRLGIFTNSPPPESSEEEVIKYAIDQENKMAEFYLSFEKSFPELWKIARIQQLVSEERSHANQLAFYYKI